MKHFLHTLTLVLAVLAAVPALAQGNLRKAQAHTSATPATRATSEVKLTQCVAAVYGVGEDGLADYYLIFSEKGGATFNMSEGTITTADDHILTLDMYAGPSSPIELPAGTYSPAESGSMTYMSDYSCSFYFGSNGTEESSQLLSGGVTVEYDGTNYTISATDAAGTTYTYSGAITFTDPTGSTYVYPQIGADVNTTFTGGMGIYHGNLYESNTGNMYINLFDCDFDKETGEMLGTGYSLALCAFNKLFTNPANARVMPGTYTMARNFKTNTYYPGLEMDYIGVTIVFGSYVKQRKSMTDTDDDYAFAYVQDGTVTITEGSADDKYNISVDCTTADGHRIKATATDIEFVIIDMSDDEGKSAVSNLDHDVDLSLDYITKARAYFNGEQNGTNVFTIDLGSPSGKDGTEGDLLRIELQTSTTRDDFPTGSYEVMEENHLWTNLYAPYMLTQGYFTDQGELTGTRYWHFAKDRYCVVDTFAAVVYGSVGIEKAAETDEYTFTIALEDGNGYAIRGLWTGPVEKNYEYTGIGQVSTDGGVGSYSVSPDGTITLGGITSGAQVSVYSADGRLAKRTSGAQVSFSNLPQGIYIIRPEGGKPIKYIKK